MQWNFTAKSRTQLRESAITQNGNTISKLTPNNSNSNAKIEKANIPRSIFALNHFTNQSDKNLSNFQRVPHSLHNVLMMSNSDDETLMRLKHSTASKVRFADEAGPSTAPSVQATPSTPNTDTPLWLHRQQMIYTRTLSTLPCQKYSPVL